ncbi:hypothetical protein [Tenacibaculum caenipelagi]|uniref:Curlin associated repeat-containing protein n=1 Tax=Tenacibaculum caenipelagi TaxID=1325435 RepID=A0A4R6TFR8_9FLAO|nr:hypothetical protein [Tenacibaculum caenipelagi]TDQ27620.1 hypothetical protein DFQ07_1471 [Tenacibaculum caenipelagi]
MKTRFIVILAILMFTITSNAQRKDQISTGKLQVKNLPLGTENDNLVVADGKGNFKHIPQSQITPDLSNYVTKLTNVTTEGQIGLQLINSAFSAGIYSQNNADGNGLYSQNSADGEGVYSVNEAGGTGIYSENNSTGKGVYSNNQSSGTGIDSENYGNGIGFRSYNGSSTNSGIYSFNANSGVGIKAINQSNGDNIVADATATSTGYNYVGQNQGANTFTVDKLGNVIGNTFQGDGSQLTFSNLFANNITAITGQISAKTLRAGHSTPVIQINDTDANGGNVNIKLADTPSFFDVDVELPILPGRLLLENGDGSQLKNLPAQTLDNVITAGNITDKSLITRQDVFGNLVGTYIDYTGIALKTNNFTNVNISSTAVTVFNPSIANNYSLLENQGLLFYDNGNQLTVSRPVSIAGGNKTQRFQDEDGNIALLKDIKAKPTSSLDTQTTANLNTEFPLADNPIGTIVVNTSTSIGATHQMYVRIGDSDWLFINGSKNQF